MKKHTIKSWRVLLDKQKIEGYLNIAKKAGYLLIGGENIKNAILHNRKIFLVIYDPSIQNNSLKIIRKVEELSIPTKSLKDLSRSAHSRWISPLSPTLSAGRLNILA